MLFLSMLGECEMWACCAWDYGWDTLWPEGGGRWQGEWVPILLPAPCRWWWCKAEGAVGRWQPQQGFKSHGGHQRSLNPPGAHEAGKASWATCFGFRCPCHRIMGWKRLRSSIQLLHHAGKHHCLVLLLLVVQGRSDVTCSPHPVCLAPSVCLVLSGRESRPSLTLVGAGGRPWGAAGPHMVYGGCCHLQWGAVSTSPVTP